MCPTEASTKLGAQPKHSQHVHGLNCREEPDGLDNAVKTRVMASEGGAVPIGPENVKSIGAAALRNSHENVKSIGDGPQCVLFSVYK